MKRFVTAAVALSVLTSSAQAIECTYKLTIGSAAMVDMDYLVDDEAKYIAPDAKIIQKLHERIKAAGYLTETQNAAEASVWVDLTANLKRLNGSTKSFYQLTVKNNLTQMFGRLSESAERGKYSKAESKLMKKISGTPALVDDELSSCPTNL